MRKGELAKKLTTSAKTVLDYERMNRRPPLARRGNGHAADADAVPRAQLLIDHLRIGHPVEELLETAGGDVSRPVGSPDAGDCFQILTLRSQRGGLLTRYRTLLKGTKRW